MNGRLANLISYLDKRLELALLNWLRASHALSRLKEVLGDIAAIQRKDSLMPHLTSLFVHFFSCCALSLSATMESDLATFIKAAAYAALAFAIAIEITLYFSKKRKNKISE